MLDKFPGLLGYGGIIAIHADWPIYPPGIGWRIALESLGNFPYDTEFYILDDIDKCKLLVNKNPEGLKDPYHSDYYHIAIWDEDLIQLSEMGYVSGVLKSTEYNYAVYQFEKVKEIMGSKINVDADGNIIFCFKDEDGNDKKDILKKPNEKEFEDSILNDLYGDEFVSISDTLRITEEGMVALSDLALNSDISRELRELTEPFINIGRLDTAIREASLLVEMKIKEFHSCQKLYGQNLLKHHITEVINHNGGFNSAAIKCYRGKLRTIFKFIRNDFAHNFKVVTTDQCKLILKRIDDVLREFHEVVEAYF